jgi:hypothetical protein
MTAFDWIRSNPLFVHGCLFSPDNPPTGRIDLRASANGTIVQLNGEKIDPDTASASWWIIFICVS